MQPQKMLPYLHLLFLCDALETQLKVGFSNGFNLWLQHQLLSESRFITGLEGNHFMQVLLLVGWEDHEPRIEKRDFLHGLDHRCVSSICPIKDLPKFTESKSQRNF